MWGVYGCECVGVCVCGCFCLLLPACWGFRRVLFALRVVTLLGCRINVRRYTRAHTDALTLTHAHTQQEPRLLPASAALALLSARLLEASWAKTPSAWETMNARLATASATAAARKIRVEEAPTTIHSDDDNDDDACFRNVARALIQV